MLGILNALKSSLLCLFILCVASPGLTDPFIIPIVLPILGCRIFGITQYVACIFHLVIKILISCLLKMISLGVGVLAFTLFDVSELTVSDINW